MTTHPVVSREDWLVARKAHLKHEKEVTRALDRLAEERRALPWVKVEKEYVFQTEEGPRTLSDLFAGRSQLIVYHFMFAPGWSEGCSGCSFVSDHFDGANLHIAHHDVALVAVSRAPLAEFLPFKTRMEWRFPWVSSNGSDFNYDFGVSFTPEQVAAGAVEYNYAPAQLEVEEEHGLSVFVRDETGDIFHSYSNYARGCDILIGAHNLLDMTPKGRNEASTMDWVRRHDEYDGAKTAACAACAE